MNNLSEGIHKIKCKFRHDGKKCGTCGIKYKHCDCFLEYTIFKADLIKYKCSICNKNCQIKWDEKIKKRCFNKYKFSRHDNNKFILLLQKGVYPDEYIDDSEKFIKKDHDLKKKIIIVT